MSKWGQCAASAAAVMFCQCVLRADLLTVQDPTFSQPIVSLAQQASPFLTGTGWTTVSPLADQEEVAPGVWVNVGTIVWQNPPVGQVNRIDNLISDPTITAANDPDPSNLPYQGCASIDTLTGNEFYQTLTSTFQAGASYRLTVAVGHNYGNADQIPTATDELRIELFYTDTQGDMVFLPSADIFNDVATGLSANHLLDFSTPLAAIAPSNPAVGQPIGIMLTTLGAEGGYFNMSNVRVDEVPEPASLAIMLAGSALLLRRRRRRA